MRKQTLQEFIEKYKKKYGNKYDFSESTYIDSHTKMTVKCKIHGCFEIRPVDLLNGYGCPKCGGTKKKSTEEFIEKARYVHNNFFSYDKCNYVNSNSKVIVTCPLHGDFEVKANNHLNGVNCKQCSNEHIYHNITKLEPINKSTRKLDTKTFIDKCKEKYGDKYSYDKTEYVKSSVKVIITCEKHGDFLITPNHFLSGRGCPICGNNKRKTTESFIQEIKCVQPLSDYDYSKVHYVNVHTPVTLVCNKCGCEFNNQPSNLLKYKQGCPRCNESHLEKEIRELLSENNIVYEQYKKFDWLGRLSLDLYLPYYNIAIECQGLQHFQPIEFFGGIDAFVKQQKNDKIKKELCEKNNIKLIYYSDAKDIDSNIITNTEQLLKIIKYGRI